MIVLWTAQLDLARRDAASRRVVAGALRTLAADGDFKVVECLLGRDRDDALRVPGRRWMEDLDDDPDPSITFASVSVRVAGTWASVGAELIVAPYDMDKGPKVELDMGAAPGPARALFSDLFIRLAKECGAAQGGLYEEQIPYRLPLPDGWHWQACTVDPLIFETVFTHPAADEVWVGPALARNARRLDTSEGLHITRSADGIPGFDSPTVAACQPYLTRFEWPNR